MYITLKFNNAKVQRIIETTNFLENIFVKDC